MVKSTDYSSWRPEFNYQHRHGSLLLSVALVLRVQCSRLALVYSPWTHKKYTDTHAGKTSTHTILKRQAQWHVPTTQLLRRLRQESCLSPVLQNQSRQHSEAHPRGKTNKKTHGCTSNSVAFYQEVSGMCASILLGGSKQLCSDRTPDIFHQGHCFARLVCIRPGFPKFPNCRRWIDISFPITVWKFTQYGLCDQRSKVQVSMQTETIFMIQTQRDIKYLLASRHTSALPLGNLAQVLRHTCVYDTQYPVPAFKRQAPPTAFLLFSLRR